MKKIHYIRHARIKPLADNKKFLCDDELHIDKLNDEDMGHIKNIAKKIEGNVIYTSTITRAIETAQVIGSIRGNIQYEICSELNEFFPNCLQGKTLNEVELLYGKNCFNLYLENPIKNFLGEETVYDAYKRIIGFIKKTISNCSQDDMWIVGHGTLHNILTIGILEGNLEKIFSSVSFQNLSVSTINYDEKKDFFSIEALNVER